MNAPETEHNGVTFNQLPDRVGRLFSLHRYDTYDIARALNQHESTICLALSIWRERQRKAKRKAELESIP